MIIQKDTEDTRLRTLCHNFFRSGSWCYGCSKLLTAKNKFLTLVWTICITISTFACCLLIRNTIANYLEYQVVTETKSIYDEAIYFPAVTICKLGQSSINLDSVVENCSFNGIKDCDSDYDFVDVYDDRGRKKQCTRLVLTLEGPMMQFSHHHV